MRRQHGRRRRARPDRPDGRSTRTARRRRAAAAIGAWRRDRAHELLGRLSPRPIPGPSTSAPARSQRCRTSSRAAPVHRAILVGQRYRHRLQQPLLEDEVQRRRDQRGDVARAGALGRLAGQRGCAGQPERAAADEHRAGRELRRLAAAAGHLLEHRARRSARSRARRVRPPPIPMSTITRPRPRGPCRVRSQCPGLAAWKVTVRSAPSPRDRSPHRSRRRRRSGRRRPPRPRRRAAPDRSPRSPIARGSAGLAAEAGPEDRVDDHRRARRAPRRRTAIGAWPGSRSKLVRASPRSSSPAASISTSTSRPSSRNRRAATSPSPPLLPLPTDDGDRDRRGSPSTSRLRQSGAGALHQRRSPGSPESIAQPSAARCCSASQQRRRPGGDRTRQPSRVDYRDRARLLVGVGQRDPDRAAAAPARAERPRHAARSRARRRRRGDTTSISRSSHASSPSALPTASLAQKRAARCWPGRARGRRVRQLAVA